jgi:hypothetical protein
VRQSNSGRRGKAAAAPTPPRELIAALRVNIDDLRPWEYGNMESDEYMRILDAQVAYRRALRAYPPQWDVTKRD